MISEETRQRIAPWLAMAFCVCLSLITICQTLWLTFANGSSAGGWATPFLCFLPMCFFFTGAATTTMRREILELRREVAELRRNNARESQ